MYYVFSLHSGSYSITFSLSFFLFSLLFFWFIYITFVYFRLLLSVRKVLTHISVVVSTWCLNITVGFSLCLSLLLLPQLSLTLWFCLWLSPALPSLVSSTKLLLHTSGPTLPTHIASPLLFPITGKLKFVKSLVFMLCCKARLDWFYVLAVFTGIISLDVWRC